jgi:hypothetical protein
MIKTIAILSVMAVLGCSKPDAKACLDKGEASACNELCETGKPEYRLLCFEMRGREIEACANGKGDCTKACQSWRNAEGDDEVSMLYRGKLGSDERVAQFTKSCEAKPQ